MLLHTSAGGDAGWTRCMHAVCCATVQSRRGLSPTRRSSDGKAGAPEWRAGGQRASVRIVRWFGIWDLGFGFGMDLEGELVKVPVDGQLEGFDFIQVVKQGEDISKTYMTIC